jgi:preprotein translocase subunit SecB
LAQHMRHLIIFCTLMAFPYFISAIEKITKKSK